jgi:sigma-B regulation protein RsbU (phosphoserine phosphatase)
MPTSEYEERHVKLGPGDSLVIYSDGVTEAVNPAAEEFDIDGMARAIIPVRDEPAKEIIAAINKAVVKFTAGAPPADDITLIVARCTAK